MYIICLITLLFMTSTAFADYKDDIAKCPEAFKALKAGDYSKARAAAKNKCATIHKLATYLGLRDHPEAYDLHEFAAFVNNNPKWPFLQVIRANASRAKLSNTDSNHIIKWFKNHHPKSSIGVQRFLNAMESAGKIDRVAINNIWIDNDLDAQRATAFYHKYHKLINYTSHKKRSTRLLEDNQLALAKLMLPFLNGDDKLLLKAKLAWREKNPEAAQLPSKLANNPDYLFEKLKFLKAQDDLEGCHILIKHKLGQKFFLLRLYFAEEALRQDKPQLAYDTLHPYTTDNNSDIYEAEWFLGWVALRYLDQPKLALKHFKSMQHVALKAQGIAKAHFWLAQAFKGMDNKEQSHEHFKIGAKYPATFYGQMCAKELGFKPKIKFQAVPTTTSKKFNEQELVKVARLLKAAGMAEKSMPFLFLIGKHTSSETKAAFIGLVKEVLPEYMVRAIKQIDTNGKYVYKQAYPTLNIKSFNNKLVFSIIRQECEFDGKQISYAGAMGLMQLMPRTAEMFAKELGIKFNKDKLIQDPVYNVTIGTAFLKSKIAQFEGSLAQAAASYNAGHVPVNRWIAKNGPLNDSTAQTIDFVEWIEKISYHQTKEYVQKVLANYAVYDQLLNEKA